MRTLLLKVEPWGRGVEDRGVDCTPPKSITIETVELFFLDFDLAEMPKEGLSINKKRFHDTFKSVFSFGSFGSFAPKWRRIHIKIVFKPSLVV